MLKCLELDSYKASEGFKTRCRHSFSRSIDLKGSRGLIRHCIITYLYSRGWVGVGSGLGRGGVGAGSGLGRGGVGAGSGRGRGGVGAGWGGVGRGRGGVGVKS